MSLKLLPEGVPLFVLLAGVLGAVVSAVNDWKRPVVALRKLIVGSVTSWYMTPLAVKVLTGLGLPDQQTLAMGGFLTGILGVLLIELIVQVATERLKPLLVKAFGGDDDKAAR